MRYQKTIDLRPAIRAGSLNGGIVWPAMQRGQWVTVGHGVIGRYVKVSKGGVIIVKWQHPDWK